ncbi:hypothetical protein ATO1_13925 [Phaeobacter sp. 22II1-1F12B]|nr:hypothetical protein [Phaeobacter sp. 22II1-1F12B]OWU78261.1 hypothetical protein ATO1_13925 [Phaeobacter sp. 22II1-1F12B]
MIELIFVACLSASPAECESRSMLYTDISTMTCVMRAQPELAKWTEAHPNWQIANWKCKTVNLTEKEA